MIWTLVPAKSFALAKSRLSTILTTEQRISLSAALLARTLRVVRQAYGAERLLVVSADADVLALAQDLDTKAFHAAVPGLNAQLAQAAAQLPEGARLLVLHADLPKLQPSDLGALAGVEEGIALCPDRHNIGTNALLQPGARAHFQFGLNSFERHRETACADGTAAAIVRRPGLAFDLDTPSDWQDFCDNRSFAEVLWGLSG